MQTITERAPAKLNLYLHILGRRADGYHLVESAAVFASLADEVKVSAADTLSLTISGEFADAAGAGEGNLVLRAARLLQKHTGTAQGATLHLQKQIPVGAGLGGGSADAAATLRALNRLWELQLPLAELEMLAPQLGADVAMCVASEPVLVRGIGEVLSALPWPLPPLHAVLVHPRTPLLTADVYHALRAEADGGCAVLPTHPAKAAALSFTETVAMLTSCRNDLETPAMRVSANVGAVLQALRDVASSPSCIRMTGSGACCFALYEAALEAEHAAAKLRKQHPEWFVTATVLH